MEQYSLRKDILCGVVFFTGVALFCSSVSLWTYEAKFVRIFVTMLVEKEISEYKILRTTLNTLREKYTSRKNEIRRLLNETITIKKRTFKVLAKANRLTRHLTGQQRQITGISYRLGEIETRIKQSDMLSNTLAFAVTGRPMELEAAPEIRPENASSREIKQKGLLILAMIDSVKKSLLQFDLLEMRCRELIIAVKKAMEAFQHEFRLILRKIYPLGIFSLVYRSVRNAAGKNYFSARDMDDVSALGSLTGFLLKLADSPLV